MSIASYAAGVVTAALILLGLGAGAVSVRRRLLSGWAGPPARLAEATAFVGGLVVLSELLGTVGLLSRVPLALGALVTGGVCVAVARRRAPDPFLPEHDVRAPRWALPAATLMAGAVVLQWMAYARDSLRAGIADIDSLDYHLPFAARYFQTQRVSELTYLWVDPVWSFYPSNSELLHAVGMAVFRGDFASPLFNHLWLGFGLLAAWVLGRPFGIPHLTLGAAAVVFAAPLFAAQEAGAALSDVAATALFIASLALLAADDRRPAATGFAGLAAGLAVGTKLTVLAPVAVITLVVLVHAARRREVATAVAWIGASAAGCGYWFVRNLVHTGHPLPPLDVPGLTSPEFPLVDLYGFSVADYIGDAEFWREVIPAGVREFFGLHVALVAGLAFVCAAVAVAAVLRGRGEEAREAHAPFPLLATLLAVGVVGTAAYVVTPLSASGPEGTPFVFAENLRYLLPALFAVMAAGGLAMAERAPRIGAGGAAIASVVIAIELSRRAAGHRSAVAEFPAGFAVAAVAWALAWGAWAITKRPAGELKRLAVWAGAAALVAGLTIGYRYADHYTEARYLAYPVWRWARTVRDARIAVVGYPEQFPLTGADISNHVQYLGRRVANGGFESYKSCEDFRRALHSDDYDFLVAGTQKWGAEQAPEIQWETRDPAASRILEEKHPWGEVAVFHLASRDTPPTDGCVGAARVQPPGARTASRDVPV